MWGGFSMSPSEWLVVISAFEVLATLLFIELVRDAGGGPYAE